MIKQQLFSVLTVTLVGTYLTTSTGFLAFVTEIGNVFETLDHLFTLIDS